MGTKTNESGKCWKGTNRLKIEKLLVKIKDSGFNAVM